MVADVLESFCCLIVYLMKECGWSILSESGDLMLVARNCITFSLPSSSCFVTLIDAFYYIEAHITQSTPSVCAKACPTIRDKVLAGITAACDKLSYTNDHPHLAVFCQHTEGGKRVGHAAVIKKGCAVCTNGPVNFQLQKQHTIWLTKVTQGVCVCD